jgi:hypothetical protein
MMKRLLLSIALGALSLAATAQDPATSVRVPAYAIEIPAQPLHMFPGDFDKYKGSYDLSNGESMTLRQVGAHIYANVGDRPRTEMVASSRNSFVAVDRQFKMTLQGANYDENVTGEMLLVTPASAAQQANGATSEVVRIVALR